MLVACTCTHVREHTQGNWQSFVHVKYPHKENHISVLCMIPCKHIHVFTALVKYEHQSFYQMVCLFSLLRSYVYLRLTFVILSESAAWRLAVQSRLPVPFCYAISQVQRASAQFENLNSNLGPALDPNPFSLAR